VETGYLNLNTAIVTFLKELNMQALKKQLKHSLALCLFSSLFSANAVMAESDQQMFLKAREMQQQGVDHSAHAQHIDKSLDFHGVFYGYVPCKDCAGIKTTLSLKQNKNYLLVTQPARDSSREFYEKGKYQWDELNKILVLTPKKGGTVPHHYEIENDETLIQLNEDGTKKQGDLAEKYALRRSDSVKTRQVHIH
jgi:uncharacterized lipoprotein NlpE involved in copper resistance